MRFVIPIVCALVGCSSADNDDPIRRAPDRTAMPPGTGWACFRDSVADESLCARPDRCASFRQSLAAEYDRAGVNYSFSPCTNRAGVACFTVRSTTQKTLVPLCFEVMSECETSRASFAGNKTDYYDVSDYCAAW